MAQVKIKPHARCQNTQHIPSQLIVHVCILGPAETIVVNKVSFFSVSYVKLQSSDFTP